MSFKIQVCDANKAFVHANHEIKRNGGTLTGTITAGVFQSSGGVVRGEYRLSGNGVYAITITKKPFIYPESMVESTIRTVFIDGGF